MPLRPLSTNDIRLAAGWMRREDVFQWLDFGNGKQSLDELTLKVMLQRPQHCLRIFTADGTDSPIGLVVLTDIDQLMRTAQLWYVLGEAAYGREGYATRAVGLLLDHAFHALRLESIHAWVVELNQASIRVLQKNGFRQAGRLRHAHRLHGEPLDRLYFDLLASEWVDRSTSDAAATALRGARS